MVLAEGRAPHPDGTEVDPSAWWDALTEASEGLLNEVVAVAVAGQQHGMVALDEQGDVVRPALLWNDTRSSSAAKDLVAEFGGRHAWAEAVGSVPVASFTVSKLRWLAENEPENAKRVAQVVLPHDWLTHRLLGAEGAPVTDRGDASGTGYWSPAKNAYRTDILAKAFGREVGVPRVAGPAETVGERPDGAIVAPGTGDNMGAALGLAVKPGDVVVSLGTSGTVFAVADEASKDATGNVAGFADATGRYLPLVCTLNAARVLTSTSAMLGVDLDTFDKLALDAEPGAGGVVLLPYLDGERTPNLPDASGTLVGLTREAMTPQNLARAAVEGMICGLADGIDALRTQGVSVERVLLVGGGAQSTAVRDVAADLFAVPVVVPNPGEYVARGAARQAAWALSGTDAPPEWPLDIAATRDPQGGDSGWTVRDAYAKARHFVHGV